MKSDEKQTRAEKMYAMYEALRDSKHVSDSKVAESTGVRRSALSDWKAGRSVPNYENLIKITRYFGVSADYFYSDKS